MLIGQFGFMTGYTLRDGTCFQMTPADFRCVVEVNINSYIRITNSLFWLVMKLTIRWLRLKNLCC